MFMPNDFGNGGGAPQQGSGGPFDLQAQLAQLPPQIRAQVMARMGMPGQGGMQAGMPDQGMNQTGPPGQGGMQPGLPNQGVQGQMPPPGGGSSINPQTGQPWDRNIGPGMRQRILAQSQQPVADMGDNRLIRGGGSGPGGQVVSGDAPGGAFNARARAAQGGTYGGGPSGRAGELGLINSPITQQPVADMGDNRLNRGQNPGGQGSFLGRINDPYGPNGGINPVMDDKGTRLMDTPDVVAGRNALNGGNTLTSMPAPVPNGNARPFRPQMSATDRAAAIAADRQMVGGTPQNVGKPQTPGMTDPPQIEPTVTGTATDVKPPVVGKPGPMPPTPSPQQDPLQKPKPKPKPTLGRNYGPK